MTWSTEECVTLVSLFGPHYEGAGIELELSVPHPLPPAVMQGS